MPTDDVVAATSFRTTLEERELLSQIAKLHGQTVSAYVRAIVSEHVAAEVRENRETLINQRRAEIEELSRKLEAVLHSEDPGAAFLAAGSAPPANEV